MPATITIRLKDEEKILKSKIKDLGFKDGGENFNNPYSGRSESEIAKMLLKVRLEDEHKRICSSSIKI